MEFKDWCYVIGILSIFSVSVASLIVTIKNRKNAIREHLYKEQLTCFFQLAKDLVVLTTLFYDVIAAKRLTDEKDLAIENQIKSIEQSIDLYYFIMPDQIIDSLHKIEDEAHEFHGYLISTKNLENHVSDKFYFAYIDLLEDIRDVLGIDNLSQENLKLIGNRKI